MRRITWANTADSEDIIACHRLETAVTDNVQQTRSLQTAGVLGRNAKKLMNPARQTGFLVKLSQRSAFRRLTKFNESAGKAPQPFLGVNASLNQCNPSLVVCYDQAGRGNRIFVNGIIAMAAEQPVPVFIKYVAQTQAAIRTKQFFCIRYSYIFDILFLSRSMHRSDPESRLFQGDGARLPTRFPTAMN